MDVQVKPSGEWGYGTIVAGTPQDAPPPRAWSRLDELESALSALGQRVEQLQVRLAPVATPSPHDPSEVLREVKPESDLSTRIRTAVDRVTTIDSAVLTLLDRLEV